MDEITGFEEQIGASFFSVFNKAIKRPLQAASIAPKKSFFNTIKKQTTRGAALDKNLANRINKNLPIPAIIKTAIKKRQAKGMSLPPAIQKAIAIKKSNTQQNIFNRLNNTVKNMSLNVKNLTRITNPATVKKATPIQRSFMPVDLPYKNFVPKTKRLKIPATNYSLSTSIDLIQPSVDGGTSNYYGK